MSLVAFKIYAQAPSELVPAGVSLYYPWMMEIVNHEQAESFMRKGFRVLTHEDYDAYLIAISPTLKIQEVIENAITYGNRLLVEFAAENVLLGITQAGKTSEVMNKLTSVSDAVSTGSLYEAVSRIKAIPLSDYDSTFITMARLVLFANKIESYLGIPNSIAWN